VKVISCDFDDDDALVLSVTLDPGPQRLLVELSIIENDIGRSVVLTADKARQAARWLDELADHVDADLR
jgi:hypothetical protein